MRHGHGLRKLNRTSSHRLAMLRNMTVSLLRHETIRTTIVEPTLRGLAEDGIPYQGFLYIGLMLAKAGGPTGKTMAAAPAIGAAIANAANASDRTQPPMSRLSIGTFSMVHPASTPATVAFSATAPQGACMPI